MPSSHYEVCLRLSRFWASLVTPGPGAEGIVRMASKYAASLAPILQPVSRGKKCAGQASSHT